MSQELTISDSLYSKLESLARKHGLKNVDELLQRLIEGEITNTDKLRQRQEIVQRIHALRDDLLRKYGAMTDSTESIREDRER